VIFTRETEDAESIAGQAEFRNMNLPSGMYIFLLQARDEIMTSRFTIHK